MNYTVIKHFCTANGPGVRTALFVSGCRLHCDGCFNSIAWDFKSGKELTDEKIDEILDSIEPTYCAGLSLLGGEPLDENNLEGVNHVIDKFNERYGVCGEKNIWLWTGYYVDNMSEEQRKTANRCDYIVDGPFISSQYSSELMFKGSKNQHIFKSDHNGKFIDTKM